MNIYIQPIKKEDGHLIVKWRNSSNVRNHCFSKIQVTEESNADFFDEYVATGKYKQYIVHRVDDQYGAVSYAIATVYLKDMDIENHRCELCIFTSDDEEWNSESQSMAIQLLLDKAFNEYDMHKVYSHVFAANLDEIELLESAGFKREALLEKEAMTLSGEYADVVRMCVIKG